MTAVRMDGKALAAKVREDVAREVAELGHVGLATVLVGDDEASHVYIAAKHKAATEAGIDARDVRLPADTSEADVLALVDRAQQRRRGRRDPRSAAASLAHERDEGDLRGLPGEGRGRLPPAQRRQPLPRDADPRAGDAVRVHGAAARVRHRSVRQGGRRDRPQRDRRPADGDAADARERHRHGLPLTHRRPRSARPPSRHRRRRRRPSRASSRPTWSSPEPPVSTSA